MAKEEKALNFRQAFYPQLGREMAKPAVGLFESLFKIVLVAGGVGILYYLWDDLFGGVKKGSEEPKFDLDNPLQKKEDNKIKKNRISIDINVDMGILDSFSADITLPNKKVVTIENEIIIGRLTGAIQKDELKIINDKIIDNLPDHKQYELEYKLNGAGTTFNDAKWFEVPLLSIFKDLGVTIYKIN